MTGWCGCGLTSGSSIRCRLTAPWRQIRLGARRRAPSIAASPLVPTSSRFPQPPACLALYSLPQACLKLASLLRSSCASCSPSPLPPALREPVRPITAPLSLYPVSPPHHPPIEPPYCPYTPTPHSLPTPFLLRSLCTTLCTASPSVSSAAPTVLASTTTWPSCHARWRQSILQSTRTSARVEVGAIFPSTGRITISGGCRCVSG